MKIAPNELRLGNWVKWPDEKDPNEVPWHLGHWLGVHAKNYGYPEGIELTPEWLERFGFENNSPGLYRIKINGLQDRYLETMLPGSKKFWDLTIVVEHKSGDDTELWIRAVHFVHELQNVIHSLTGRELELKK